MIYELIEQAVAAYNRASVELADIENVDRLCYARATILRAEGKADEADAEAAKRTPTAEWADAYRAHRTTAAAVLDALGIPDHAAFATAARS